MPLIPDACDCHKNETKQNKEGEREREGHRYRDIELDWIGKQGRIRNRLDEERWRWCDAYKPEELGIEGKAKRKERDSPLSRAVAFFLSFFVILLVCDYDEEEWRRLESEERERKEGDDGVGKEATLWWRGNDAYACAWILMCIPCLPINVGWRVKSSKFSRLQLSLHSTAFSSSQKQAHKTSNYVSSNQTEKSSSFT